MLGICFGEIPCQLQLLVQSYRHLKNIKQDNEITTVYLIYDQYSVDQYIIHIISTQGA